MSGPRPQRGVVFPSPVVLLSILAVVMAATAFVLTRHHAPTERAITASAQQPTSSPSSHGRHHAGRHQGSAANQQKKKQHHAPVVHRAKVPVVVFNNSGITGLAAQVSQKVSDAGWDVVGADNWYGSIPANTVYYPARLKAAAKQLALDLGVDRTAAAVAPMKSDRLTVILTGPLHSAT